MPALNFIEDRLPARVPGWLGAGQQLDVGVSAAGIREDWREIEEAAFSAYEAATGLEFRRTDYNCYLVSAMRISGYTYREGSPAILAVANEDRPAMRTTLIHELGHVLALEHTAWHARKLLRLWVHTPTRHLSLTDHLLINTLHEEVAREVLGDGSSAALDIARSYRGLRDAWRIIDGDRPRIRRLVLCPEFERRT